MCRIVGILPDCIIKNDRNCGGAQYVFNHPSTTNPEFWEKVLNDCVLLYNYMQATLTEVSPNHPIQAWTADMWALLWNLWLFDANTEISNELSFSWPSSGISEWNSHKIFHNAGVTADNKDMFYKGNYLNEFPFDHDHSYVNPQLCSSEYVKEFEGAKKLLI
jgi:hypothetical protein